MSDERCENCRFWLTGNKFAPGFGRCHGAPPQVLHDNALLARYPVTSKDDLCGMWQPDRSAAPSRALDHSADRDPCDKDAKALIRYWGPTRALQLADLLNIEVAKWPTC